MRFPGWTVVLCCFATLSGAQAAPPTFTQVSAGGIALAARPGGMALAVDLDALARDLCAGEGRPTIRASAECGLTVANFPLQEGQGQVAPFGLRAGDAQPARDGRISVQVTPSALELAGAALLQTPCGSWQLSLLLDPAAFQSAAPLTLHPAAERPAQGAFAGVIEVAVVLHLVPLDAGGHPDEAAALDLPFTVTFQLAGAWAIVPDPLTDPADSNLLLFAGFDGGLWRPRPGCHWTIVDGVWCEACVEPVPDVLERINRKLSPAGGSPPF